MAYNIIAAGNSTLPASTGNAKSTVTVAVTAGTEEIDSYAAGTDTINVGANGNVEQFAQQFTNDNFFAIKKIVLKSAGKTGTIVGDITVALYTDEDGSPGVSLGSDTFDNASFPADGEDVEVEFSSAIVVSPGDKYWVFIGAADQGGANSADIYANTTDADASAKTSTDGSTWGAVSNGKLNFEVYGEEPAMTSDDKVIIVPTSAVPKDILLSNSWYVSAKAGGSFTVSSSYENFASAMTFDYFVVSGSQDE